MIATMEIKYTLLDYLSNGSLGRKELELRNTDGIFEIRSSPS